MVICDYDRCVAWISSWLLGRWCWIGWVWFELSSTACRQHWKCCCFRSWFLVEVGRNPWLWIPIRVQVALLVVVIRTACDFVLYFIVMCENSSHILQPFSSYSASITMRVGGSKFSFHQNFQRIVPIDSRATAWSRLFRRINKILSHGKKSHSRHQMVLRGVEVVG